MKKTSPDLVNPNTSARFSPFWPVFAVFFSFLVIQGFALSDAWKQRAQLQASWNAETEKALAQAQTLERTLENLSRDLVAMASTNLEAAKIVGEFNIRMNADLPAQK